MNLTAEALSKPHLATRLGRSVLDHMEPVVILAALVTIPLTLVELDGQSGESFLIADWAVWAVFALEYTLGLLLADDRRRYVVNSWLLLVVVLVSVPLLPTALGLFRMARLGRVLRLVRLVGFAGRALPALKVTLGRRGLLYLLAVFALLITVSGAVMSLVEPQTVHGNLWDGMWWAVVTTTTVGYGDISPTTLLGRVLAATLMLFGIGLAGTLAASIAAYFVNEGQRDDMAEVMTRLDRLEKLILGLQPVRQPNRSDGAEESESPVV